VTRPVDAVIYIVNWPGQRGDHLPAIKQRVVVAKREPDV
jgi:hypothetical protein